MKSPFLWGENEDPPIHLTPLIDVVFVLLITFIVVAPLLPSDRIQLPPAPKRAVAMRSEASSPISLEVRADNTIWLNGALLRHDELTAALARVRSEHPGVRPLLYHDRSAQFGTYQMVKNACEEAGYEELNLVLEP